MLYNCGWIILASVCPRSSTAVILSYYPCVVVGSVDFIFGNVYVSGHSPAFCVEFTTILPRTQAPGRTLNSEVYLQHNFYFYLCD